MSHPRFLTLAVASAMLCDEYGEEVFRINGISSCGRCSSDIGEKGLSDALRCGIPAHMQDNATDSYSVSRVWLSVKAPK